METPTRPYKSVLKVPVLAMEKLARADERHVIGISNFDHPVLYETNYHEQL